MLGESFFEAGHELVKASSYTQVSDLLFGRIRTLVGAAEAVLFDFATDLSSVRVVGDGPVAEMLRQDMDGVRPGSPSMTAASPMIHPCSARASAAENSGILPMSRNG